MSDVWMVHISDLHLGHQISGGGWQTHPGHSLATLHPLSTFLRTFVADHPREKKLLVITGDATALGQPDELALYRTLLERGFVFDTYSAIPPLAEGFEQVLEVPGNADYWDGNPYRGQISPRIRRQYFPRARRKCLVQLPQPGCFVAFHSLCSTLGASQGEQLSGVGAFDPSEVAAVERDIRAARGRTHHFLLTHHSPSFGDSSLQGLSARALAELQRLSGLPRVRGLLTGHAHASGFVQPNGNGIAPEVRSSSTLRMPVPGSGKSNGLVVHELNHRGTHLDWHATEYVFAGPKFLPLRPPVIL